MVGIPLSVGNLVLNHLFLQSGYKAKTPVQTEERADERGMEIRYPKANELFVDIDSARDFARFKTMVEMLGRIEPVKGWTDTPSASGGQHRHITVTLGRTVSDFERIALQAMLGSDLKRELLSFEQLKTGVNPHPTVFFEPKAGVTPKAKKTGFHCTGCNLKNEFAEANQDDGTYLCFNCRTEE